MIAIKELTKKDELSFANFLSTKRKELPSLKLAKLVKPHTNILVCSLAKIKNDINSLDILSDFSSENYGPYTLFTEDDMYKDKYNLCGFSGYCYFNEELLIGCNSVLNRVERKSIIDHLYGEYCFCKVTKDGINLTSDFFGMSPWFYYYDGKNFAASNNYHLLLLAIAYAIGNLEIDIPRSRVNVITSGFTFGSPFHSGLDVKNFNLLWATEDLFFSIEKGLVKKTNELWDILNAKEEWNEEQYAEYIDLAKNEICSNVKAAFKYPQFNKVVIDLSGGFDSRVVFAAATQLNNHYKNKLYTYTRRSGTPDDVEKASAITNIYSFPKYSYAKKDTEKLIIDNENCINLDHVSRTLGCFTVNSHLYTSKYTDDKTLELTGGVGDCTLGYKRIRGELDYSLGDQRLLARLGGCYLHNSVTQLKGVFEDQKRLINETLNRYKDCDCLFKKNHLLYTDARNRFNFGSSHNVENDNMRIPLLFSKYALKAKWMYFNLFSDNKIPFEKVSIDLIDAITPLLGILPFTKNNDDVIPQQDDLLNHLSIQITPDFTIHSGPKVSNATGLYVDQVKDYMKNLENAEQMILHIYDYSKDFEPVCLGLFKVLEEFRQKPDDLSSSHGLETIRKIFDLYFQIDICEKFGG